MLIILIRRNACLVFKNPTFALILNAKGGILLPFQTVRVMVASLLLTFYSSLIRRFVPLDLCWRVHILESHEIARRETSIAKTFGTSRFFFLTNAILAMEETKRQSVSWISAYKALEYPVCAR